MAGAPVIVIGLTRDGHGGIERVTRELLIAADSVRATGVVDEIHERFLGAKPSSRLTWAMARAIFLLRCLALALKSRRRRPGILVMHVSLAPLGRACAALAGGRFGVVFHGRESWQTHSATRAAAVRAAQVVIAPSHFTASRAREAFRLDANAIDVVRWAVSYAPAPTRRARGKVLTVARLTPECRYKGVDTLIAAWPRVIKAVPDAVLRVVGDGSDRERLTSLAAELGVEECVDFLGSIADSDLVAEYASAEVFVLASRTQLNPVAEGEGLGLAALEAAAHGVPVIVGGDDGASETVVHGTTGLIVDTASSASVGDAVVSLLENRSTAARFGNAGRAMVRSSFSQSQFRDSIETVLRRLVG